MLAPAFENVILAWVAPLVSRPSCTFVEVLTVIAPDEVVVPATVRLFPTANVPVALPTLIVPVVVVSKL